VDYIASYNGC